MRITFSKSLSRSLSKSLTKALRSRFSKLLSKALSQPFSKQFLILVLTGLVLFGALPGYVSGGAWRWVASPPVKVLNELKNLRQQGIALPGWQIALNPMSNHHHWVQQTLIAPDQSRAMLLLLPQKKSTTQPQVEWMDLDGLQGWKTDSDRSLEFTIAAPATQVTARFKRSWTPKQTYAVLQWYAWSGGGHFAPSHWFVADRLAQWHNRRAAWVAVTILLPIEPLDDIEKYREKITAIAQTVQATLMTEVLKG